MCCYWTREQTNTLKSISYLTKYSKLCVKNILLLTKNNNKTPLVYKRPNFNLELDIVYS